MPSRRRGGGKSVRALPHPREAAPVTVPPLSARTTPGYFSTTFIKGRRLQCIFPPHTFTFFNNLTMADENPPNDTPMPDAMSDADKVVDLLCEHSIIVLIVCRSVRKGLRSSEDHLLRMRLLPQQPPQPPRQAAPRLSPHRRHRRPTHRPLPRRIPSNSSA